MPSLTETAQRTIARQLAAGDLAIDATAGKGHDTLFLARQVSPDGQVLALDLQQAAIEATALRLQAANLSGIVELQQACHTELVRRTPQGWHQRVAVIMFNLGYLPGSDRLCITRQDTTLPALEQAVQLLKPGGMLSVMLYPGHPGGEPETRAVLQWARQLPASWQRQHEVTPGPQWLLLQKRQTP